MVNLKTHFPGGQKRYPVNRLRQCWNDMRKRCLNPANGSYKDYGGRGVAICARWSNYDHFAADVGPHPGSGFQFDRIDNDKGYEPGNVKWSTAAEQSRNKRNNIWVERDGVRKCLMDWCAELGLVYHTVLMRTRRGKTPAQALGFVP